MLIVSILIGLYKHPEVHPVGVRDIWRPMMANFILKVAIHEAKEACGVDQLYGGMEA